MSVTNVRCGAGARSALLYQTYGLGREAKERMKLGEHRATEFISDYGQDPQKAIWAHIKDAERVGKKARRGQAITLIHSFSKEEIKDTPAGHRKVRDLSYELAKRLYPNSGVTVVVHNDAKGGNVHSHITVTNEDWSTGGAIRENKLHWQVKQHNDALMVENGLSVTEPSHIRESQATYWAKVRTQELEGELEDGYMPKKKRRKIEEKIQTLKEQVTWEDTIRESVEEVMLWPHVTSFNIFKEELENLDEPIGVNLRYSKKTGEINSITYSFTTPEGVEKKRSGAKLGGQYTVSTLKQVFENNQKEQDLDTYARDRATIATDTKETIRAIYESAYDLRQADFGSSQRIERLANKVQQELADREQSDRIARTLPPGLSLEQRIQYVGASRFSTPKKPSYGGSKATPQRDIQPEF